jgi:predicted nucleotidyltransferase
VVKTAIDVRKLVDRFVALAEEQIVVEKVILSGEYARGVATDHSDIRLLVISSSFEGMEWTSRGELLALVGMEVDVLIQSWGFTPRELENAGMIPFLTMMLAESRQIYPDPADADDAGGLR